MRVKYPNTYVKSRVAQLVEHRSYEPKVLGSSPSARTFNFKLSLKLKNLFVCKQSNINVFCKVTNGSKNNNKQKNGSTNDKEG